MDNYLKEFFLNEEQEEQFQIYYQFLVEENEKINLTSITKLEEVYIKHFVDSLQVNQAICFTEIKTICDIGSGAGFPSIPLKILYPHLELTMIEPIGKRTKFLNELVTRLKLKHVNVINGRAEDVIALMRDQFDVCVARAVSQLPILLELCIPFVKVGGYFIAMKGTNYQEELETAKNALLKLNCTLDNMIPYHLPLQMGERTLLKIKKNKKTSAIYPRKFSLIKKQAL